MPKRAIFDKRNILITGGAGFIGSHLCDELVKEAKVICLDNFSSGDERNIDHLLADKNFIFLKHDISEPIDLEAIPELERFKIKFQGIQEVYHLACPTSPKNFEKNIIPTIFANSFGVVNGLEIAKKYNAKFMLFSSSVVYGPRRQTGESGSPVKISENDLGEVDMLSERGSYDEGKRFAETIAINYKRAFDLDVKIARLFRIYGPRMKLNDGQMIPDFIANALDGNDLTIYGDENFHSSFCYVSDCIDAVTKLMQTEISGPLNIGSDLDVKIKELANKIIQLTNSESKIKYESAELFFTSLCLPDISKVRNSIGWMPIVTLEKGLAKSIDDLRASKGLKTMISSELLN